MVSKGYKRKLTTIMSANVVGYSRLMGEDETATIDTLTSDRGIMAELIKQHRGRVADIMRAPEPVLWTGSLVD